MLNHNRTSTVSAATIVLFVIQFLLIDYVTGLRGHERLMHNAFSRKIRDKSTKAREMYLTRETNDVIHSESDVTGKQEVSSSSSSSSSSPCPTDCECDYKNSWLEISCENRSTNATSLSDEINAYLTGAAWNCRILSIMHTPLTALPESVCQLKRLTQLKLHLNRFLTRLPDNCFTRLHKLQYFGARYGGLTSLQNGLFDNLTELLTVSFTHNSISSIGAHLFDVTANLPNLHTIDLTVNNLTEIDTWPIQRAQLFRYSRVYLSNNRISRFTNSLGWHYNCSSAPLLSSTVNLSSNDIRHLNGLFRDWNITGMLYSR